MTAFIPWSELLSVSGDTRLFLAVIELLEYVLCIEKITLICKKQSFFLFLFLWNDNIEAHEQEALYSKFLQKKGNTF